MEDFFSWVKIFGPAEQPLRFYPCLEYREYNPAGDDLKAKTISARADQRSYGTWNDRCSGTAGGQDVRSRSTTDVTEITGKALFCRQIGLGWSTSAKGAITLNGPYRMLFDDIYRQHFKRVFNFGRAKGLTKQEAEDLAQDVFVRVHERLHTFREESSIATWIDVVARSVLLNKIRAGNTNKRTGINLSIDEDYNSAPVLTSVLPNGEQATLERERYEIMKQGIESLPEKTRQVIEARLQGFSFAKIAAGNGTAEATTKSQWSRGLQKLKSWLIDRDRDDEKGRQT
ncbi:MAG: RNA polymerase sigma factor [Acidobacteriota bacterium]|nr:RNA polymerase sigma factor [Acidobacteriota bacterium]